MDAYAVMRLIEDIGATSSRIEKEKLTTELASSDIGRFVLKWTYDPFITFGVSAAPTQSSGMLSIKFKESLIEPLLKKLASRALTGKAAEREIGEVMAALDKDGAKLLYLILSKDLKCGIAETTINTAMPGLIPVFSVMRAHSFDAKKVKSWPMKGEYKLDGQRNTFLCVEDNGGFFTRSGKRVPALDFLVPIVMHAAQAVSVEDAELNRLLIGEGKTSMNFMLDGEAMMGLFEETGALRRKDVDAVGAELHLYDIMPYDDFNAVGSVGMPLNERRRLLSKFVHIAKKSALPEYSDTIQIVPQYFIEDEKAAIEFFSKAREKTLASYLARGNPIREAQLLKTTIDRATGKPKVLEGAMFKNPDGLYDKKKSFGWMKMKAEETEDLRVVGAFPGEPGTKYENCLGGLIVDRAGVQVRVGGGFTDPERQKIWKLWEADKALDAYADAVPGPQPVFALLGRLIEVEFHEVTPDGSLRHPRFVRFRDDKDGEVEQKEAA